MHEHRLDAARRRIRQGRRVARGLNREQVAVAQPQIANHLSGLRREALDERVAQVLVLVEQREGAFLLGEAGAGLVGPIGEVALKLAHRFERLVGPVSGFHHHERRAIAEVAQADAPLLPEVAPLFLERDVGKVVDVVEEPDRERHQLVHEVVVNLCSLLVDQLREVEVAQEAHAADGKNLLPAGIRGVDVLDVAEVVFPVDGVDKDDAGLVALVRRLHDLVPDLARRIDGFFAGGGIAPHLYGASLFLIGLDVSVPVLFVELGLSLEIGEAQRPVVVVLDGLHELVGDENGHVELVQPTGLLLGFDELDHVRVPDAHGDHLSALSNFVFHVVSVRLDARSGDDRGGLLIPDVEHPDGARRHRADAADAGAAGPHDVAAKAVSALTRQDFCLSGELGLNLVHRVLILALKAGDEAVDERRFAEAGSSIGKNPTAGGERKRARSQSLAAQKLIEALGPRVRVFLDRCHGPRVAVPRVRYAVVPTILIVLLVDFLGNRGLKDVGVRPVIRDEVALGKLELVGGIFLHVRRRMGSIRRLRRRGRFRGGSFCRRRSGGGVSHGGALVLDEKC